MEESQPFGQTCAKALRLCPNSVRPYEGSPPGTRSSILAWRIPWTGEPDRLHIVHGVARVGHNLVTNLCPWDSPGGNTGVGCHALLQGIVLTQGWNPRLQSTASAGRFFITSTTSTREKGHVWGERNLNLCLTNYVKSNTNGSQT